MRVDFQKNDYIWSYLHYNTFKVGSPSAEYPLTVAGYTGGSGGYFTTGGQPAKMLNLLLMIMIMTFGLMIVQLAMDVDGGTTNALILILTISHPYLIGQQKYGLWR